MPKSLLHILFLIFCLLTFAAPLQAQEQQTHTVQRGETLFRIGLRYGCTVAQMSAANNLANPNRIFVGQVLIVPQCQGASIDSGTPGSPASNSGNTTGTSNPAGTNTNTVTVQRGETLSRIGLRYGCTVAQMAAANNLTNPNGIFVGQVLIIPECQGGSTNSGTPGIPVSNPGGNTGTANPANATNNATTDNWCYGGRPWGDGRCNPANDPTLRDWYWKAGWYMAQVERGLLRSDQIPSEFRPIEGSPADMGGTTNGGSSGGGGTVTSCTSGTVLQLVNCARAADGKGALSSNGLLDAAALGHANDMVTNNFFSHTGSNGSSVGTRVTAAGYSWSAENASVFPAKI